MKDSSTSTLLIIIGLIISILIIFFDVLFLKYIFSLIPESEWKGLIKIVIIFIDIWFAAGICIFPIFIFTAIGLKNY